MFAVLAINPSGPLQFIVYGGVPPPMFVVSISPSQPPPIQLIGCVIFTSAVMPIIVNGKLTALLTFSHLSSTLPDKIEST
jgi:hypothetical protein